MCRPCRFQPRVPGSCWTWRSSLGLCSASMLETALLGHGVPSVSPVGSDLGPLYQCPRPSCSSCPHPHLLRLKSLLAGRGAALPELSWELAAQRCRPLDPGCRPCLCKGAWSSHSTRDVACISVAGAGALTAVDWRRPACLHPAPPAPGPRRAPSRRWLLPPGLWGLPSADRVRQRLRCGPCKSAGGGRGGFEWPGQAFYPRSSAAAPSVSAGPAGVPGAGRAGGWGLAEPGGGV